VSRETKPVNRVPARATASLGNADDAQSKRSGRVFAFGEVLWDQLPNGAVIGGAPANFASRVQSLGVDVTLVSRVGQDDLGQESTQILQRLGLSTDCIQRDAKKPTGTVQVTFDDYGSPSYDITKDVAYDYIACTSELVERAKQAEMIYFGTLAQRTMVARQSLSMLLEAVPDTVRLCDVNLRVGCFTKQTVSSSLRASNILKLNEVEVTDLADMFEFGTHDIEAFCDLAIQHFGLDLCLVTRGPLGAFAKHKSGERIIVPGYSVKVVDTIGAGDAFTAGFVWSHVRGQALADCIEMGVRCGALVATHRGGMVPITVAQLLGKPFSERKKPT
jgi:fructokinase